MLLLTLGVVSTALWTGVYLSDVLEYVKPLRGQAKHVIFEGGDSLPQGPYGTSQRLSWTASKEKGMLIGEGCCLFFLHYTDARYSVGNEWSPS